MPCPFKSWAIMAFCKILYFFYSQQYLSPYSPSNLLLAHSLFLDEYFMHKKNAYSFKMINIFPRYFIKWYQWKVPFLFLFILLWENCGSLNYKKQREKWLPGDLCRTFAQLSFAGRLSRSLTRVWEAYWRFRILEVSQFWTYIPNPEICNRSLSEYHTHEAPRPIADNSGSRFRIL